MIVERSLVLESFLHLSQSLTFQTLVLVTIIDLITGRVKALKGESYGSYNGLKGLNKHAIILLIVMGMGMFLRVIGYVEISDLFNTFYIIDNVVSVLENLEALGIPFPDSFKRYFNTMREQKKQDAEITVNSTHLNVEESKDDDRRGN